jgi:GT2 family glycosyltransferase
MTPSASIVIPTRARLAYLEVALTSIVPQADDAGAEVLVIDDAGSSPETRALVERLGARYEPHPGPLGLNVARNTGVDRSTGELVVFADDDVRVRPGWLQALLDSARRHQDVDVFTGPIEPRLEGRGGWARHSCGREGAPITSLDLGPRDTDTRYAWGANMTIRRAALARVGPFEVALEHAGDEQEWQDRLRAATPEARVLYVAAAALEHRRAGPDAHLRSLARAAYSRGRASRRFDSFHGRTDGRIGGQMVGSMGGRTDGRAGGRAPHPLRELLTLVGCFGHVLRRRCPAGLVMVAHSAGRLRESLRGQPDAPPSGIPFLEGGTPNGTPIARAIPSTNDDFLSGASGTVGGVDAIRRGVRDEAINAWELASGRRLRLNIAARRDPPRRKVLVLGVERPEHRALAQAIRGELERSRHSVELNIGPPGALGKFENLNRLLASGVGGSAIEGHDWLLLVDDDVVLPRGFLDRFLFLAERISLDLAQPAHRLNSHAAWPLTRRRPFSVVRETPFVEIGPVTALHRRTFPILLPFPELRMGWGLDAHWAALAREHDWRCGIIDAVSIRHRAAPAAAAYSRDAAVAEARAFLAERPYLSAAETQRTLTTHSHW